MIAAIVCGLAACAALIAILLTNGKVAAILLVVVTWGWAAFSVYMFFRNRKAQSLKTEAAAESITVAPLGKVPFAYLPHEAPTLNGWEYHNVKKAEPTFSALPVNAPVSVGLSIKSNGWYGIDYPIKEAQQTKCNRLIFAAKFETDGVIYALLDMPSRVVGGTPIQRWLQFGVNIGPTRVEDQWNEGVVELIGKQLRDGWMSFDVSLDDAVARTFGKRDFFYGKHGKLLKIRLRGSLSISEIELYGA